MYKALHPRDDIDRLYVTRKEGKGFASIENCENAFLQGLQGLKDNIKRARKDWLHLRETKQTIQRSTEQQ